jgi:CRP-like cAMP-binding protein
VNEQTIPLAELRQHYLFNSIEDNLFEEMLQRVRHVHLKAGDTLFQQEEPARHFYYLRSGQIKLSRISIAGQEKVIEITTGGQVFAEAVMFMERANFPVNAQAIIDSEIYSIPNLAYRNILKQNSEYCFRLLADLSMRLHGQLQELDHLAQQNASYRLVRYLINQLPDNCGNRVELELTIPKQVLASKLSIKPESFSRLLAVLSNQGIISVLKTHIVINDVQRLRNYE